MHSVGTDSRAVKGEWVQYGLVGTRKVRSERVFLSGGNGGEIERRAWSRLQLALMPNDAELGLEAGDALDGPSGSRLSF